MIQKMLSKKDLKDIIDKLIQDIREISDILNEHSHNVGIPPPGTTWPYIDLPQNEAKRITAMLEGNGGIVADLRRISEKLTPRLTELAQDVVDSHNSCFTFSSNIENDLVYPSDKGMISNLIGKFYTTVINFQTEYRAHKSYNQDRVFRKTKSDRKISPKKVISAVLLILVATIGGGAAVYHFNVNVNSPTAGDNSNTGNTQSGDGNVNVAGSGNPIVNTGPGTINVIQNPPSLPTKIQENCSDEDSGLTYRNCNLKFEISRPNLDWFLVKDIVKNFQEQGGTVGRDEVLGGVKIVKGNDAFLFVAVVPANNQELQNFTRFFDNYAKTQYGEGRNVSWKLSLSPEDDYASFEMKIRGNANMDRKIILQRTDHYVYNINETIFNPESVSEKTHNELEQMYNSFNFLN